MRKSSALMISTLLIVSFLLTSCGPTYYYKFDSKLGWNVMKQTKGPKADNNKPQPGVIPDALIMFLLTQENTPLPLYFEAQMNIASGKTKAGFLGKPVADMGPYELEKLGAALKTDGCASPTAMDYARKAAQLMTPAIQMGLETDAYAYIGWGAILTRDKENGLVTIKGGVIDYSIQLFPQLDPPEVRFFYHAPFEIIGGQVQRWDVSAIPGVFEKPTDKIAMETIKAKLKLIEERPLI